MTHDTGSWPGTGPPYVGYALVRAAHLLTQKMDRELAALGLSATGFGVLFQVRLDPEVSAAELARRVILTPQSIGPLLARLERDGLVERQQPGASGTRITTHITRAGTDRLLEAMAVVQSLDDDLVDDLEPAERTALGEQLWTLLGGLSGGRDRPARPPV